VRTVDPKIRMRWKLESRQAMEKAQMMFVYSGIKVGKRKRVAVRRDHIFLEAAIAKARVNDDIRLSFQSVTGNSFALRRDKEAVKCEEDAFVAPAKRSRVEIVWNIFVGGEVY
jgi:hypothetical protein